MPKPAGEQLFNAGGRILEHVLKLENPPFFFRDDRDTTLSQQGEYLPLVLGRRRVAPVQCWTGVTVNTPFPLFELSTVTALIDGGFKNLLEQQDVFYEPGIQAICIGPANRIHMIYQDGVPFLRFPDVVSVANVLNSVDAPSGWNPQNNFFGLVGFTFDDIIALLEPFIPVLLGLAFEFLAGFLGLDKVGLDPIGYFSVYWGENNQPRIPNDAVVAGDSLLKLTRPREPMSLFEDNFPRFPHVCFIHYILKYLGANANWQAMEYDVEVRPHLSRLAKSLGWLDVTPIGSNPQEYTDSGVNPAHALCQLLNAPFPHGLGIPEDFIDFDSLELLGQVCENEHIPVNILAKDGMDAIEQITQILDEAGVVVRQAGRKMQFMAIREPDPADIIDITPDILIVPEPEQEIDHTDDVSSALVEFNDRDMDYRQRALTYDDDAIASLGGGPKPLAMELENITDVKTAQKVLMRRAQELLSGGAVDQMVLGRGAREFLPGQPINLDPVGLMRVVSMRPETDSAATHVTARLDNYSIPIPGFFPEDDPDNVITPPGNPAATEDDAFDWIEPPVLYLPQALSLWLLRIPNDDNSHNANALGSADDVTYVNLGNANAPAFGGTLQTEILADDDWFLDSIDFDMLGYTMSGVQDLTGQDDQWRNGIQWVVIGTEIFYARTVTALSGSGDPFTITDLIRGRYGTAREAHTAGDVVYIFRGTSVQQFQHASMVADALYYVKSQPVARLGGAVDPDDVTAVSHLLRGNDDRPPRPHNFHGTTATLEEPWHRDKYRTGEDIVFTWTHSVKNGGGQSAGEQDAGAVIADDDLPPDGSWQVEIFNGTVLERTLLSSVTTLTYSNAALVADFGGEPASFLAVLTQINAGLESDSVESTVELVA